MVRYKLHNLHPGSTAQVIIPISAMSLPDSSAFRVKVFQQGTYYELYAGSLPMTAPAVFTATFTPTDPQDTMVILAIGWQRIFDTVHSQMPYNYWFTMSNISVNVDTVELHPVVSRVCAENKYMYGYNGQIRTDEWAGQQNHYNALFWEYDPRTARRGNLDPSPLAGASNYMTFEGNPIWFSDVMGNTVDEARAKMVDQQNGTKVLDQMHTELQSITGLVLKTDEKNQQAYEKDVNGNPVVQTDQNGKLVGSPTARDLLVKAINDPKNVSSLNFSWAMGTITDMNTGVINMDPGEVSAMILGTVGADKRTLGFGMIFLHELSHTRAGGSLDDDQSAYGELGQVESRMNIIRGELGGSFGLRLSYKTLFYGGYEYIPFSYEAKDAIYQQMQNVPGAYAKYNYSKATHKIKKEDIIKSMNYYKNLIK